MPTPTLAITKVSSVVRITNTTQGSVPYKSFFSPSGEFSYTGNTINLKVNGIPFVFDYNAVQLNGAIPSTLSEAITLLTSIFGS